MTSPGAITTNAVVVRLVDFGESDRIVGLFTRSCGLVSAVARGARRSRKRFAGALQTGHLLEVDFVRGRGALGRLDAARLVDAHLGISTDLGKIEEAAIVLRAVRNHLPDGMPDETTFDELAAYLGDLSSGTVDACRTTSFRLRLFDRLGVGPEFDRCVICGRAAPVDRSACFDAERGGVVCRSCGGASVVLSARARSLARAIRALEANDGTAPPVRDALTDLTRALEAFAARHLAYRRDG